MYEKEIQQFIEEKSYTQFTFTDLDNWRASKGIKKLSKKDKIIILSELKNWHNLTRSYTQNNLGCDIVFKIEEYSNINHNKKIPFYNPQK